MGTYYNVFLCYKFRTTQYIINIVPYFIFKTFNDFSLIFFSYKMNDNTIMYLI